MAIIATAGRHPACELRATPADSERGLTVVAAAILGPSGQVNTVPRPGRHRDVIHAMHEAGRNPKNCEQGFLLSDGTFASRERAKLVAVAAGQLLPRALGYRKLFSEDVW